MKILVAGGTSGTGRRVVEQALERGHEVTLLARDPDRLDLKHASLRVVKGDVLDVTAMGRVVSGHDAVIFAVGATLQALKQNPTVFSDGTRNTIEAMQAAGVKRLVVLSSHGTGDSKATAGFVLNRIIKPLFLAPYFDDHERQEAVVRPSPLDWVIVRPWVLTNGPAKGRYKVVEQPGAPAHMRISRADVAGFMLSAVETDQYVRKAVSIG
jgi:putative NADH-flavin reductase